MRLGLVGVVLAATLAACTEGKDDDTDSVVDDTDSVVEDTDPVVDDTDGVDTDPVDTDPVDTDPVDTDPIIDDTDPVDTDPVDTDPVIDDTDPPLETAETDPSWDTVDTAPAVDTDVVVTDTVFPELPTVAEVTGGAVPVGTLVEFEDLIMVAVFPDSFAAFTVPGGGPESGLIAKVPPGQSTTDLERVARLRGEVIEVPGPGGPLRRVDTTAPRSLFQLSGSYLSPSAALVTVPMMADVAQARLYEGAMVTLDDARVWDEVGARDWELGDATTRAYGSGQLYWPGAMTYGDVFDQLNAVVRWDGTRMALYPRRSADVVGLAAFQTPADFLAPGDVVISEWMVEGSAGVGGASCTAAGSRGEYLELANTTGSTIDIDGMYVFDVSDNEFVQIRRSVELLPGERVVAWASPTPCYGLGVDVTYGFTMRSGLNPPWAGLFNDFLAVDLVWLNGFSWTAGVALELGESSLDATANDLPGAWCDAGTPVVSGSTDLGTPGAVNDCP
jgi:hypothetical protein